MLVNTPKGNVANVFYQYEGIPKDKMGIIPRFQGYTIGNKVIIQLHLKEDRGLLIHELTHVDQWYDNWLFSFRYRHFKTFRLKMETEAFANQLKENGNTYKLLSYAAELSSDRYSLDITVKEATRAITSCYKEIGDGQQIV